jgi:hypothetical protein
MTVLAHGCGTACCTAGQGVFFAARRLAFLCQIRQESSFDIQNPIKKT